MKNLTDDELVALEELMNMTREELDRVPYEIKLWGCQCKNCKNASRVRDYGVSPFFFSPRKGKKWGWKDLRDWYYICGRHWKFYKRLLKSYDRKTIDNKLLDGSVFPYEKVKDIPDSKMVNTGIGLAEIKFNGF